MYFRSTLAVGLAWALTSFAQILPLKSTDPGQTFTVATTTNPTLNGKGVNVYFNSATSNLDDYDVVTKLGAPLIYQLRQGVLYSQQQVIKTGAYQDTGLVGGLEVFEPPIQLFEFRNQSNLVTGSNFKASSKKWYLKQVGATGTTYDLLATTAQKSHGFFACRTPDKPPTKFAVRAASAKKSHYVIVCEY